MYSLKPPGPLKRQARSRSDESEARLEPYMAQSTYTPPQVGAHRPNRARVGVTAIPLCPGGSHPPAGSSSMNPTRTFVPTDERQSLVTEAYLARNREFESSSLQQRVNCEPVSGHIVYSLSTWGVPAASCCAGRSAIAACSAPTEPCCARR